MSHQVAVVHGIRESGRRAELEHLWMVDISKGASPSPNAVDSQGKAEVSPAHMSTC